MARDLIPSKLSLTGGIGGQSNRRSSIPKLVQAEDRENGAFLASLQNGAILASLESGVDYRE